MGELREFVKIKLQPECQFSGGIQPAISIFANAVLNKGAAMQLVGQLQKLIDVMDQFNCCPACAPAPEPYEIGDWKEEEEKGDAPRSS